VLSKKNNSSILSAKRCWLSRCLGVAPIGYLTELRINLAMRRLLEGKKIKTLYQELGYSSASSFTRIFQQKHGVSPKEWLSSKEITQNN
jgi:AraC-like DNA-binding protein